MSAQALLNLLQRLEHGIPLDPLGITTGDATDEGHPRTISVAEAAQPRDGFFDANGAEADDKFLDPADSELQELALGGLVVGRADLGGEVVEADDGAGEESGAAVDGAGGTDGDDGEEMLTEAREGRECRVVD